MSLTYQESWLGLGRSTAKYYWEASFGRLGSLARRYSLPGTYSAATMAEPSPSPFLNLPAEIREHIYRIILNPDANRVYDTDEYTDYSYRNALVLFRLNQQIYYEARKVFRDLNVFVRVQTPFPNAREYVAIEGHVPVLMKDRRATRFNGWSLNVQITAPQTPIAEADPHTIVILMDDLEKFTTVWCYSDLSNPGLNRFLSLELELRDPHALEWEEKRMPKWLQQQLIAPFGTVKNLRHVDIGGDPKPLASIESEMRAEQEKPYLTPEQCLSETARLKDEGNAELKAGNYHAALELYTQAWAAMFIIIKGRQRHVHGEAYFARELRDEPYKGKSGQMERLALRIQLVANTCLAYLKLEDWEEVIFWGMRTIRMFQQMSGADEREVEPQQEVVPPNFPGRVQIGRIYYRTAMAYKACKDRGQTRKLLKVAQAYMPHDQVIQKELADLTPQLG
ncbi:putative F-box domain-containing protein [Seiridium cardinale]